MTLNRYLSRYRSDWQKPQIAMPALLLAFLLAEILAATAFAASPAAERCDKDRATPQFSSGMADYGHRKFKEAIPNLEEAVNFCPAPSAPWSITVGLLGDYPYTPFYYIGKCHLSLKDFPTALRHFYLSGCFDNPHQKVSQDLAISKEKTQSKERPQSHPLFSAGFSAAREQKWEESAEKMWDAINVWKEDGKTTYSYGRWPDPYLPRFRLAEALFRLGCCEEAGGQLDKSLLKDLPAGEVKGEREQMEKLKPECQRRIQTGSQNKEICQRWQCLLKQSGL